MTKNEIISDFINNEFIGWYLTRGRYLNSHQKNVLAQFMPSKSSVERDYRNSPFCNAFYLAMQLQLSKDEIKYNCFLFRYFKQFKPKTLKEYLHVDLKDEVNYHTANRWGLETAESIYSLAVVNTKMWDMMNGNNFSFSGEKQRDFVIS